MKIKVFLCIAAVCQIFSVGLRAQISQATAADVSRCMFVYAPIYEVSKTIKEEKLRSYAIERLVYIRGALKSVETDPGFKQVFETNLSANKRAGVNIENALLSAYRSGNSTLFNLQLSKAAECDDKLGLTQPTK